MMTLSETTDSSAREGQKPGETPLDSGRIPSREEKRGIQPFIYDCDYIQKTVLRDALLPIAHDCTGVVVDFGCGSKPYVSLFDRASRYIGTDVEVHNGQDLRLGEDGNIPLDDGFADTVVSFLVLEHVPDVSSYLRECSRVLRSGGKLIVVTHGIWTYHPVPNHYEDYWRWTEAGLARAIAEHGFELEPLRHVCGGWLCLVQQFVAISDPWVVPDPALPRKLRRCATAMLNWLAIRVYRLVGTRPARRGDIVPIMYIALGTKK